MVGRILSVMAPLGHPLCLVFVLLTLFGLRLCLRRRWGSGGFVLVLMAGLWLASNRPLANGFIRSLEVAARAAPVIPQDVPSDAPIVILGGGYRVYGRGPSGVDLGEASDRLIGGLEFAADRPEAPVIVGGHRIEGRTGHGLDRFFARWSIAPERVWTMDPCMDTHDEAVQLRRLADREGFTSLWLVTSAYHMRRAQAVIRAQGLTVFPYPVDFDRTYSKYPVIWPDEGALELTRKAWREVLGLWIYRLRGWI